LKEGLSLGRQVSSIGVPVYGIGELRGNKSTNGHF